MSEAFSRNENSVIISNSFNCSVPDDKSKILAWLSPLEPWIRHRDIGTQRIDSVGGWLLETKEFRRWHNGNGEGGSNHPTLFCEGNPGVGKSYIVSLVIDKLCDEAAKEDTAVTCFYFDFAARNEQSPINMLGSLLRQLVSGLKDIPEAVLRGFQNKERVIGGRGLQISGVLKMFQDIAATKRTFICVDALDECVPEHRMEVLGSLGQILQESPDTRIFMTGRPHVRSEVETNLDGAADFLSIQPTSDGVVRFLGEKLRKDTTPNTMNRKLREDILMSIPEISSETFLLASLLIEAILRETTISRRRKRLQSMKDGAGLGGAYGVTLERIKAQGEEKIRLAVATLTWVCHSERPLQVGELCYALAVEIGAADFDPENIPLMSTLLDCCQGLITVDKEASTVQLIHVTVQKYLRTQPDFFSKPHSVIAETCLTYLNSPRIKNLSSRPLPDHHSIPFLDYSSRYWGTHANRELSDHARALALELLNQYEGHVSAVSLLEQVLGPGYIGDFGASPLFSGLHCASFFGITQLVTALIKAKGCEINRRDCGGSTPLSWAVWSGHEGVVKLLLERGGVDPNRPDEHDLTPLGWAGVTGHEQIPNNPPMYSYLPIHENLGIHGYHHTPYFPPIPHYPPSYSYSYTEPYHHPSSQYQKSDSASPYLHPSDLDMSGKGTYFNIPQTDAETYNNMQPPHTAMPATLPISRTTTPARSPSGLPLPTPIIPETNYPEIVIAVMGVTGTGKSHFIREVSGISDIEVSSNLHSCTATVQLYSFPYAGAKITLVDTPGFGGTIRSDIEVLGEICAWTSSTYRNKKLLSGIIYLHRITDVRMGGSSLKNLRMFERLCGEGALGNVLLSTTQWGNVDPRIGQLREGALQHGDFWGGPISKGASLERFLGTEESGLELIQKLMKKEPRPLCIQEQMVEKNMTLVETDAGKFMIEELISREKEYQERLGRLERDHEEAVKQKDNEMREVVVQEQSMAQEELKKAAAERRFLAGLCAAVMKEFGEKGSEREEDGGAVIAVKKKSLSKVRPPGLYRSKIRGRLIYDIDDPKEFLKDPLDFTIHYESIFIPASNSLKTTAKIPNTGVRARNFLFYNGAVYLAKPKGSIQPASRGFVIYSKV